MSAAGVVIQLTCLKQCDLDFPSALMIELQVLLWHSPLYPMRILGGSKGSPLPTFIKFSYSKRMLSPAKTNDVTFAVLFLQRSRKVFTKVGRRAGKLRVSLRRHLQEMCRRLKLKFYRSFG